MKQAIHVPATDKGGRKKEGEEGKAELPGLGKLKKMLIKPSKVAKQ